MNQSIEKRQSDSARLFYYDAPDAFGERINIFSAWKVIILQE